MNTQIDAHWTNYYDQGKDFGLITTQALTKILPYTHPSANKTCLDIGCGTGQLTRELWHRGFTCVGIDISSKAITTAVASTNVADLQYIHFDIESDDISVLPLQPYSLITCKLVFAFIKNKESFLTTVASLLQKNGSFVIITPTYKDQSTAKPISVEYDSTLQLLEAAFRHVSAFTLVDDLTCFVCK